ncbi:glycoside hydrolase family 3 C-terminal domain-containing protein [Aquimarina sp. U1-2]|uniref:glycoside hydrolase family 3 N-terminal domain-containing protein n=1 Tax=Aquimarina sp. U1-2 TaxID=2823141 RepID=UPI001AEC8B3B|nr:glycoside hydrolase family 3 N-terminal domain-containing protein [Aquimarina sp. U1-2]MBP2832873.1 glycoside hydrolase family 3 C-terminal domain-containing protein [Aquimarina sp. U1-2]
MKYLIILVFSIFTMLSCSEEKHRKTEKISNQVDQLIQKMSLKEKVGQLNMLKGLYSTDIYEQETDLEKAIKAGQVGGITPYTDMEQLIKWQKTAVDSSRLGIPLFFSFDVVHGYQTMFPIPLAQSCSWDLKAIENADRIAAIEASASGINWVFGPVLDLCRDARWGRNMETAGEDAYLASQIAKARVRGYQGKNLKDSLTVMACAKHFAGYGAVEGGLDYNAAEISERHMREYHLKPFKAAVEEGITTVMNAFNTVNGIPSTQNDFLLKTILQNEWSFGGFTVSDANSIYELIPHGVAKDQREAAIKSFKSGSNTDLWSEIYMQELPKLIEEGVISEHHINEAVRRVLELKQKLGLFEDPYRYLNPQRQKKFLGAENHRKASRELATKSFVLLENKDAILPLDLKKYNSIALIGPMNDSREFRDLVGNWAARVKVEETVTIVDAFEQRIRPEINYTQTAGCGHWGKCKEDQIREAVTSLQNSDIGIVVLGENGYSSGEGGSKTDVTLPGNQEELIKKLAATGKPIILLVMAGRPLVLTEINEEVDALMLCWQPGTEAGNAIVDMLLGEANPSGKLTMSFPYHQGQVPIYYNHLNTGRPPKNPEDKRWGITKYSDAPREPLYPFGYGLSYTSFEIKPPELSHSHIKKSDTLKVSTVLKNTGDRLGAEVVQLYIRDLVASVARPIKELKAFKRIVLKPGEEQVVTFQITEEDLKFWDINMNFIAEPGQFEVYIGNSSHHLKKVSFTLKP